MLQDMRITAGFGPLSHVLPVPGPGAFSEGLAMGLSDFHPKLREHGLRHLVLVNHFASLRKNRWVAPELSGIGIYPNHGDMLIAQAALEKKGFCRGRIGFICLLYRIKAPPLSWECIVHFASRPSCAGTNVNY